MVFFGKIDESNYGFDVLPDRFGDNFVQVDDKTHMGLIESGKKIVADDVGQPILVEWPEPSEKEKLNQDILSYESYLNSTDWYAVRFAETGDDTPATVSAKRQEAREKISELRLLISE